MTKFSEVARWLPLSELLDWELCLLAQAWTFSASRYRDCLQSVRAQISIETGAPALFTPLQSKRAFILVVISR